MFLVFFYSSYLLHFVKKLSLNTLFLFLFLLIFSSTFFASLSLWRYRFSSNCLIGLLDCRGTYVCEEEATTEGHCFKNKIFGWWCMYTCHFLLGFVVFFTTFSFTQFVHYSPYWIHSEANLPEFLFLPPSTFSLHDLFLEPTLSTHL